MFCSNALQKWVILLLRALWAVILASKGCLRLDVPRPLASGTHSGCSSSHCCCALQKWELFYPDTKTSVGYSLRGLFFCSELNVYAQGDLPRSFEAAFINSLAGQAIVPTIHVLRLRVEQYEALIRLNLYDKYRFKHLSEL